MSRLKNGYFEDGMDCKKIFTKIDFIVRKIQSVFDSFHYPLIA